MAATALVHRLALATHNVDDFAWIDGLIVVDPLGPTYHSHRTVQIWRSSGGLQGLAALVR